MSVNVAESLPLVSKESNKLGTDFILCNQRFNKTNYREHLETHEGDTSNAICTRTSGENKIILKDRDLDTACIVMDPNQPPAKS